MGKVSTTSNAAREVRAESGEAAGLSSTAADVLSGRGEKKTIATATQVCSGELSTQGCLHDGAGLHWAGAGSSTMQQRGERLTQGSEIGQQVS